MVRMDAGAGLRALREPAMIGEYLSRGDTFGKAIAALSIAYADQTERDYELLKKAARKGELELEKWPWRTSIQQGLAPVSIGLLLAGCFTMAKGAITGAETAAISVAVLLILLQYKINPALLVVGGAVIGVLSFMPK